MDHVAAPAPDFVEDFDLDFNLDLDLDADEFSDVYSAFQALAEGKTTGWLGGLCGNNRTSISREGSSTATPADSGLTDEDDGAMSAYVAELEQFLMEDDDEVVSEEPITAAAEQGTGRPRSDDGCAEEEDCDDDVLAAREDHQPASRKRARHKIKGTPAMMPWRAELEVKRRHLARIQVPAASCACSAVHACSLALELDLVDCGANAKLSSASDACCWPLGTRGNWACSSPDTKRQAGLLRYTVNI